MCYVPFMADPSGILVDLNFTGITTLIWWFRKVWIYIYYLLIWLLRALVATSPFDKIANQRCVTSCVAVSVASEDFDTNIQTSWIGWRLISPVQATRSNSGSLSLPPNDSNFTIFNTARNVPQFDIGGEVTSSESIKVISNLNGIFQFNIP